MALLNEDEIQRSIAKFGGWMRQGTVIRKEFEFSDFIHAMEFVNSVSTIAERANHHPDIDIRWNKVTLALSTHSAGGITEKDISLARDIESTLR